MCVVIGKQQQPCHIPICADNLTFQFLSFAYKKWNIKPRKYTITIAKIFWVCRYVHFSDELLIDRQASHYTSWFSHITPHAMVSKSRTLFLRTSFCAKCNLIMGIKWILYLSRAVNKTSIYTFQFWQNKIFLSCQFQRKTTTQLNAFCYFHSITKDESSYDVHKILISPCFVISLLQNENFFWRHIKVSKTRKQIVKSWILPKNEQMNSTLLLWNLRSTCFRSFFGRNWRHQKDISKITDL